MAIDPISAVGNAIKGSFDFGKSVVGGVVRTTLARKGDKVQQEQNASDEFKLVQQLQNQYTSGDPGRTFFDMMVDNLKRMIHPLIAYPFIFLFWVYFLSPLFMFIENGKFHLLMNHYKEIIVQMGGVLPLVLGSLLGVRQMDKLVGAFSNIKTSNLAVQAAKVSKMPNKKAPGDSKPVPGTIGDDFVSIKCVSRWPWVKKFSDTYAPIAIEIEKDYKLPAVSILAHAALETSYGRKVLKGFDPDTREPVNTNNIFNIKSSASWAGKVITKKVSEDQNQDGNLKNDKKIEQTFRAYPGPRQAFEDYAQLLTTLVRYKPVAEAVDPEEFVKELKNCGYMTDAKAPEKLIKIMRNWEYLT